MKNQNQGPSTKSDPVKEWDQVVQQTWNSMLKPWSTVLQDSGKSKNNGTTGGSSDFVNTTMKVFQKIAEQTGAPSYENFQETLNITPDIAFGFAQNFLNGFSHIQEHVGEWIKKRGEALSVKDIQELDREFIKKIQNSYDQDYRKYLKIPQLGLGRLYQERSLGALDKLNSLQLILSDFLQMLSLPIEQSLTSLQEEILKKTEEGPLDDKPKTYYKSWIKYLENHYLDLFKRPEYSEAMRKTLWALNEFNDARQEVTNDILRQAKMPTNQDMDELSKEIYLLKKRMRLLEKQASQKTR